MIDQIAERLNELAVEYDYDIASLHKHRGVQTKKIFTKRTIRVDEKWAFHDGGRHELQFNIGVETLANGKDVFRFGVAFSLDPSQTLPDPPTVLHPAFKRFNAYAMKNREVLSSFKMWHAKGGNRPQRGGSIPFDWFQFGNFIFIGRYFIKPMERITDTDLFKVLDTFDKLLPIYLEVQQAETSETEEKISKICWNYNSWRKPSGLAGKSKDKLSHERSHAYGHEEWLFDFDKLVDGYHYTFLQPVGKHRNKYVGNTYNLSLYSVNTDERNQFYWVARIENAEAIDKEEEKRLIAIYEAKGWLDEMYEDLKRADADLSNFDSWVNEGSLFNVRFRPQDVHPYGPQPIPFGVDEKISHNRYTLLNHSNMHPPKTDARMERRLIFSGTKQKNGGLRTRQSKKQSSIECSQLHTEIQNALVKYLESNYPAAKKIELEVGKSGCGTSVDAVMEHQSKVTFFEVKTYTNAKHCIREAIGQLMEYSYYSHTKLADELVVVSQAPLETTDREYLESIRSKFSIPVTYWQFFSEEKFILEKAKE